MSTLGTQLVKRLGEKMNMYRESYHSFAGRMPFYLLIQPEAKSSCRVLTWEGGSVGLIW